MSHSINLPVSPESFARIVAHHLRAHFGKDVRQVISKLGWHLRLESEDSPFSPIERLAVWEGDTKTIRVFLKQVRERFQNLEEGIEIACAHEIFHGLSASEFRALQLNEVPALSRSEEEAAASQFASEWRVIGRSSMDKH